MAAVVPGPSDAAPHVSSVRSGRRRHPPRDRSQQRPGPRFVRGSLAEAEHNTRYLGEQVSAVAAAGQDLPQLGHRGGGLRRGGFIPAGVPLACAGRLATTRRAESGAGGALRSKGPASRERLSPQQWARLEQELKKGPLAHGFAGDQRWTLGPDQDADRQAVPRRLHPRGGVEADAPARLVLPGPGPAGARTRRGRRRGVEGRGVARYKSTARDLGAFICFEDEAGQGLRPPKGRTWAPRGARPVVRVRGAGGARVSIAGVACYRPGDRPHLSTSCAPTAAARARPRGSPGRTTGT